MTQQALTQDEVDALLAGVNGESLASGQGQDPDAAASGGVRTYDLSTQERIVRGRMPTLEIVNERFARNFRIGAFNFIHRNPEIAVGPVVVQKFSAFLRNVAMPANINVVHVRPLRGMGLVICDPTLVFTVIDNLFGGGGHRPARVEGREFSPTELRIILRLMEVVTTEYARSWSGIYPIELEYARSEMHPQFANIAAPSEVVITTSFDVAFGDNGGKLHLCIPYSTFEPIREVLHSPLRGDQGGPDTRWLALLTEQIQTAEVELVAELGNTQATVRQLLALKAGDFIELERTPTVVCKVEDVPVFDAECGLVGTRYGLCLNEFLINKGMLGALVPKA